MPALQIIKTEKNTYRFTLGSMMIIPLSSTIAGQIHDVTNSYWMTDLVGTASPKNVLQHNRKSIAYSDTPVFTHLPLFDAWNMPIVYNHTKIGYISIFSSSEHPERTLPDELIPFLPYFTQLLGVELGKQKLSTMNKANFFNGILTSLLNGERNDVKDVRNRLRIFNYDLHENMYLLKVEKKNPSHTSITDSSTADYLAKLFGNCIYTNYDFEWYFLISRPASKRITYEDIRNWGVYLGSNQMRGGLTGPFTDFRDMRRRREETELAIGSGKRLSAITKMGWES